MSPNEFIMNARLKYAAELLRNHPELQITEIAYQTGFSSLRYFRHCFKACFNQVTTRVQRKVKNPVLLLLLNGIHSLIP